MTYIPFNSSICIRDAFSFYNFLANFLMQVFNDFARNFYDFARIFSDFARIFYDFARNLQQVFVFLKQVDFSWHETFTIFLPVWPGL